VKITYAVGWYYPDGRGGTEAYVAALARHMQSRGHDVQVVAPEAGLAGTRTYEHEGVRVFRYGVSALPTRAEVRGSVAARGAEALHAWLQRERPDLVHVHAFVTGLGLAEVHAARAVGARVWVTTHAARLGWLCERGTMLFEGRTLCDGIAEQGKCTACVLADRGAASSIAGAVAQVPRAASAVALAVLPGRSATLAGMPALIADNLDRQRELFGVIEGMVVLTEWARRAVVANGAPSSLVHLNRLGCVVPAGGMKPSVAAAPTRAPVTVGYVGRLDAVKGVDVLAQALRLVPASLPLRIVLRGPVDTADERAVLDGFRAIVGDDARVSIGGGVSRDAMGDVLRGLDVLVCPSRTLEGGPTIAIEAMAVGTPVIGSAIGGLAELVEDGAWGRLVPPEDARALADVLVSIARDPAGTVDAWRAALPAARTMHDVAVAQEAMYGA
jgi:glycosyltransferase involved in cell wall biosynthesis